MFGSLFYIDNFLGVELKKNFSCCLPNHLDIHPSSSVFVGDDGCHIYKCYSCNNGESFGIINLIVKMNSCTRKKAIDFIKKVYDIDYEFSEWDRLHCEKIEEIITWLENEVIKNGKKATTLYKLIWRRKNHLIEILRYFQENTSGDLKINDKPLFYCSYDVLTERLNINRKTLSQSLTLFALLRLIEKIDLKDIPENARKIARLYCKKYKKITNFYFINYIDEVKEKAEKRAKILKDNNMTLDGLTREFVIRTFGKEEADKIFPQYKFLNFKASKSSDNATANLVKIIFDNIEMNGYCLEKAIKGTRRNELQYKRSINSILKSYSLVRLRLNDKLKEYFSIKICGFPIILIPNDTYIKLNEKDSTNNKEDKK